MSQLSLKADIEVQIDYHALFIYDELNRDDPPTDTAERALKDVDSSGLQVGAADKLIAFSTPVQFNYNAPMRVEVWSAEPPSDDENWDHVVDIDLDLPSGRLMFRQSGSADEAVSCEVPPGTYRVRFAGRGMTTPTRKAEGSILTEHSCGHGSTTARRSFARGGRVGRARQLKCSGPKRLKPSTGEGVPVLGFSHFCHAPRARDLPPPLIMGS